MNETLPELQIFADVYKLQLHVQHNPENLYVSKYELSDGKGRKFVFELESRITDEKMADVIKKITDHFCIILN